MSEFLTESSKFPGVWQTVAVIGVVFVVNWLIASWLNSHIPSLDRLQRLSDDLPRTEPTSRFRSMELVRTTHELNYSHGGGLMVPAGACLQLISLHHTTSGPRWSAKWLSDDDENGIYVYPIPEEFLEPVLVHH